MKNLGLTLTAIVGSFFFLAIGCGGGTRGSGGQYYDGFVGDSSGRALSDVSVTILATGDSAVTDINGSFSLKTDELEGPVEFLLEAPSFSGKASREVPANSARVFVTFSVAAGNNPRIDVEIEVKESKPKPTRIPTASATHSNEQPPSPGALTTPSPTAEGTKLPEQEEDTSGGNSNSSGGSSSSGDDDNSSDSNDDSDGQPSPVPSPTMTSTPNEQEGKQIEAEGNITSLSSTAVVVQGKTFVPVPNTEYRGKKGEKLNLADFQVGDSVEARGIFTGGVSQLEKLKMK